MTSKFNVNEEGANPFKALKNGLISPEELEKLYVNDIYEEISEHFNNTRRRGWPMVDEWLSRLPANTLIYDVGAGNGKYARANPYISYIGSDISPSLINIAAKRTEDLRSRGFGVELLVSDALVIPFRKDIFDVTISIAVIHHFSNRDRRKAAIQEMLRVTKPNGQLFITVWAKETTNRINHKYETANDQEQGVGENGDVLMPWTIQQRFLKSKSNEVKNKKQKQKQKHKQKQKQNNNESETNIATSTTTSDTSTSDTSTTTNTTTTTDIKQQPVEGKQKTWVFQRYYHLFAKGELEDLIHEAAKEIGVSIRILESDFSYANWYCAFQKVEANVKYVNQDSHFSRLAAFGDQFIDSDSD